MQNGPSLSPDVTAAVLAIVRRHLPQHDSDKETSIARLEDLGGSARSKVYRFLAVRAGRSWSMVLKAPVERVAVSPEWTDRTARLGNEVASLRFLAEELGGAEHGRLLEPRCGLSSGGELGSEPAEHGVLRALVDERVRREVEEGDRATVAEDDLIPLGQAEQVSQAVAYAVNQVPDGSLAVRGAHQAVSAGRESLEATLGHLGGARAESSVGRQQVSRNLQRHA